jgi:DNA-directed RNA polymerase
MTTVYGVTFVGAREQIERQLRVAEVVDPDARYQTAAYLAKVVSHTLVLTMKEFLTLVSRHFAALAICSEAPQISKTG